MSEHPETGSYQGRLGDEQFIRFHSKSAVQIFFIEPFFEERNFLRRTLIELARTLARKGIGSIIPDLPGTGESPVALNDVTFSDWRDAAADASRWIGEISGKPPHIAALRGGALIDDVAAGASWWRFAPVTGADLLRPMRRAANLIGEEGSLASYPISSQMLAGIEQATPQAVAGHLRECHIQSEGAPLWRRAEPGEDPHLVAALADDIAQWIETCVTR